MVEEDWKRLALCKTAPQSWFFPEQENSINIPRAKAVCRVCPVREACLNEALLGWVGNLRLQGVWGGTTEKERVFLRGLLGGRNLRDAVNR